MKVTSSVHVIKVTIELDEMEAGFLRCILKNYEKPLLSGSFGTDLYRQLEPMHLPKYSKLYPEA